MIVCKVVRLVVKEEEERGVNLRLYHLEAVVEKIHQQKDD